MEKIIDLFKGISKPYIQKEGGEKLEAIQAWLSERGISSFYMSGIGLVVNPVEKPRVVLVSHMDLISLFKEGFEKNQVYKIEEGEIIGALDNTITNAVALLAYEELLKQGVNDVEFFLSEGEEQGMWGMRQWCKTFYEKGKNTFFVNLDVTNEGYDSYCSVEYDKPCFTILKQLQDLLPGGFFTESRVCDDIDAVNSAGFYGFSYCLPTKGHIHSYKNKSKVESLQPYYEGLLRILEKLNIKKCDKIFARSKFSKALEVEKYEDIVDDNNEYEEGSLEEHVESILEYTGFGLKRFSKDLRKFLLEKNNVDSLDEFSVEELKDIGFTDKECDSFVSLLIDAGVLDIVGSKKYKFFNYTEYV